MLDNQNYTKQFNYLFTNEKLTPNKVTVLCKLYNRFKLSIQHKKYYDPQRKAYYIIYTYQDMSNATNLSEMSIRRIYKTLNKYISIIKFNKRINRIYLTDWSLNFLNFTPTLPKNNKKNKSSKKQHKNKYQSQDNSNELENEQHDQKKQSQNEHLEDIYNNNKYIYYNNNDKAQEFSEKLLNIGLNKRTINVLFNYFHNNIGLIYHAIHLMINIKAHYHLAFEDFLDLEVFLVTNLPFCINEEDFMNRFSGFCYRNLCNLVDQQTKKITVFW